MAMVILAHPAFSQNSFCYFFPCSQLSLLVLQANRFAIPFKSSQPLLGGDGMAWCDGLGRGNLMQGLDR